MGGVTLDNVLLTEHEYNGIFAIWGSVVIIWTLFIIKTKNEKKAKWTLLFFKMIAYFSLCIFAISFVAGEFNNHPSYLTLGQIALSIVSFIEGIDNFFELLKLKNSSEMVEPLLKKVLGEKQNFKVDRSLLIISISIIVLFFFWIIGRWYLSYQDWNLLIKLIVGIVPFIVAYFVYGKWSKNREKEMKEFEYKNDYYKKIINKRMDAYEKISAFISRIGIVNTFVIPDDERAQSGMANDYFKCFESFKSLENSLDESNELTGGIGWVTEKTRKVLMDINNLLADAYSVMNNPNKKETMKNIFGGVIPNKDFFEDDEKYLSIVWGCKQHNNLYPKIIKLKQFVHEDYQNMDDVKTFLDQNMH
jgi:hypothetical protein